MRADGGLAVSLLLGNGRKLSPSREGVAPPIGRWALRFRISLKLAIRGDAFQGGPLAREVLMCRIRGRAQL